MLQLTRRDMTETILIQPEHIVYVERGGDGRANVYLTTREMLKVEETVEQVDAAMRGQAVFGQLLELKSAGPVEAIPDDEAAETETTFGATIEVEEEADADDVTFSIPTSAFADEQAEEPPPSGKNKRK